MDLMFGLLMSFVGLISVFSSLAIIAVACVGLKKIFKQSVAETEIEESKSQTEPETETMSEASVRIKLDGEEHRVEVEQLKAVKDSDEKLDFPSIGEEAKIIVDGEAFNLKIEGMLRPAVATTEMADKIKTSGQTKHCIRAPMRGTVVKVPVRTGDRAQAGTTVLVLETMKMENAIQSPVAGTVRSVKVSVGDSVDAEDILVIVE